MAKPMPGGCAIDGGGFVQLLGYGLQSARIVIPKKGTPRQMLAKHTEEMAKTGSPRN